MSQHKRPGSRHSHPDRGSGLFSMVFGIGMFLLLLLFAVQVIFSLYARSVVTSVSYEGARTVAGFAASERRGAAAGEVSAEMRSRLGQFGQERLNVEWNLSNPDVVVLHVTAELPTFLPILMGDGSPFSSIDRTFEVRAEELQ